MCCWVDVWPVKVTQWSLKGNYKSACAGEGSDRLMELPTSAIISATLHTMDFVNHMTLFMSLFYQLETMSLRKNNSFHFLLLLILAEGKAVICSRPIRETKIQAAFWILYTHTCTHTHAVFNYIKLRRNKILLYSAALKPSVFLSSFWNLPNTQYPENSFDVLVRHVNRHIDFSLQ